MALKVHICAVGKLRSGPERDLLDDYLTRFDRTGRALGLGPVAVHEVEDRKGGGMAAEAGLLEGVIPLAEKSDGASGIPEAILRNDLSSLQWVDAQQVIEDDWCGCFRSVGFWQAAPQTA